MTDVEAPEKAAEAKEEEKPFNTDILESCTARFTRRAWDLYSDYKTDLEKAQNEPVRAQLTAETEKDATQMHEILVDEGQVKEITRKENIVLFTAPFSVIQLVIKKPGCKHLDAIRI